MFTLKRDNVKFQDLPRFIYQVNSNYEQNFKLKIQIKLKTNKLAFDLNWSLVQFLAGAREVSSCSCAGRGQINVPNNVIDVQSCCFAYQTLKRY